MKCPHCDTAMCSECGIELRMGTTVPEELVCEDHQELCSACAADLWCVDCYTIRKERK